MESGYAIPIILVIILFVAIAFFRYPDLESILGAAGVSTALITAIIALALGNKKQRKIEFTVEKIRILRKDNPLIPYTEEELKKYASNIQKRYKEFKKPIEFFIVGFELTNTSDFTWEEPTFTYRTPVNQRYINSGEYSNTKELPHINEHFSSSRRGRSYLRLNRDDKNDKDVFTLRNLPYLNSKESLDPLEFTLFLDASLEEFSIDMSINCKNAEGGTESIKINSGQLLKNFKANN